MSAFAKVRASEAASKEALRLYCQKNGWKLAVLKGGKAGVTAREIARLKKAASSATVKWMIAAFDGEALHLVPDDPMEKA